MADYKSAELTLLDAAKSVKGNAMDIFGKVRVIKGTYTMLGTEALNSTIELCRLTKGVCVVPLGWAHAGVALGTDIKLEIGFDAYTDEAGSSVSADPDAFLTSTSFATAGTYHMKADAGVSFKPKPHYNTGTVSVIAKIGQTTTLAITAATVLEVFLVVIQD